MGLLELRKQKADLIGWYIVTKDKAIRKAIRQLDKEIKKGLEHGQNNLHRS